MCLQVTTEYKSEVREKIMESAVEYFAKIDFDRTKMDDIANVADPLQNNRTWILGTQILAILEEIGVIDLEAWVTWTTLLAVLAAAFGLEYRYNSKSGSCYIACGSKA
jgi:hypothetical protein